MCSTPSRSMKVHSGQVPILQTPPEALCTWVESFKHCAAPELFFIHYMFDMWQYFGGRKQASNRVLDKAFGGHGTERVKKVPGANGSAKKKQKLGELKKTALLQMAHPTHGTITVLQRGGMNSMFKDPQMAKIKVWGPVAAVVSWWAWLCSTRRRGMPLRSGCRTWRVPHYCTPSCQRVQGWHPQAMVVPMMI